MSAPTRRETLLDDSAVALRMVFARLVEMELAASAHTRAAPSWAPMPADRLPVHAPPPATR